MAVKGFGEERRIAVLVPVPSLVRKLGAGFLQATGDICDYASIVLSYS
jgi:hypothetical protein